MTRKTFFPVFVPTAFLSIPFSDFPAQFVYCHMDTPLPPPSLFPWPFHTLRWNVIDCHGVGCDQGCWFALRVSHSQWNWTNKQTTSIARILQSIKKLKLYRKKMHKLLSIIWMVLFNGLPTVSKVATMLSYNMAEASFDLTLSCTKRDISF